ncbi:uncharacterized protein MKZ38_000166 [Zalerion maritima]|uniref:TOG domain-containing protein n=1 Tax=Zalerion maritima TaxID=339359 RepID=A0AAD5RSM5_9PEZI|nr:uncharacterized protein MKZ38_000166 [Zalerion maritima]
MHSYSRILQRGQSQGKCTYSGCSQNTRGHSAMADKLTDQQVVDLLTTLRSDAIVDTKVAAVTAAKSSIKQHNVPDTCIPALFDALRMASQAQNAVLVNAGFSSLGHLLTRLTRQEPKWISKEAGRTLPIIVDKMGDQKEKFRTLACQAMTTVYQTSPIDAERFVRNIAMCGKNPRAKETSLHWLLQRHQEDGLQFRSYVPQLMELLEDADAMVRDAAKHTVTGLFRSASGPAKSDLKRQLKNFKVRPAIEQAIVKELNPGGGGSERPESRAASRAGSVPPSRPNLSASVSSMTSERPMTPLVPDKPESVEPLYVNTVREFDDIIRDMTFHFEGKETEQNWLKREESATKLRRLLAGNASSDYPDQFIGHLRSLLDGIIKAVNSLRTSLSKEGCSLVQDMVLTFGPGIDPMVELLLQAFIKLCASTKKIASQSGNTTVDLIIGRVTYTTRIMQHIWGACQDKNVQPRTYAPGWLKTVLNKEAGYKNHIEHGGGVDLVEKCIHKGLADPNPGVREKMRSAFWLFHGIWRNRADTLMGKLDGTAQKLLLKDANNPNSPPKREATTGVRPGLGLSKSTMGPSTKPSLRETLLQQKRAAMAAKKTLPQRPGSAMSHFSPVRIASSASNASTVSTAASSSTVRGLAHSGVSGAPVRPTRKRPEVVARPATAGPYSVRGHDAPGNHNVSSPTEPKLKTRTAKTIDTSPKRTMGRRPGHAPHASESSLPSPGRLISQQSARSPRHSPRNTPRMRPVATTSGLNSSSPAKPGDHALEEFTLVVPHIKPPEDLSLPLSGAENGLSSVIKEPEEALHDPIEVFPAAEIQQEIPVPISPVASTPTKTVKVYEDPFVEDQTTPKPTAIQPPISVLEDKPVNENAAAVVRLENTVLDPSMSPEKSRQNAKLLDSGITRVKAKSLDVHGLRKLQSIIRDNKAPFTDEKFDALLMGLFEYLESPMANTAPEKVQDVKAQVLSTVKLLLKKAKENFQPHVSRGLEALLVARAGYDSHTHIVSGLELLADELVTLGDASEIVMTMTRKMKDKDMDTTEGRRSLSMGLHVLKEMIDAKAEYQPSESELAGLSALAGRCLESSESGVRMDAVQLCVALHSRLGEPSFWDTLKGVRDDPKSLITYYVVKRQREIDAAAAAAASTA